MQHSNAIFIVGVTAAVVTILLFAVVSMIRTGRGAMRVFVAAYCLVVLAWMAGGGALGGTIVYLGGAPGGGKVEGGHYYVGMHGRYTEVSPRFFKNLAVAIWWEERVGIAIAPLSAIMVLRGWMRGNSNDGIRTTKRGTDR